MNARQSLHNKAPAAAQPVVKGILQRKCSCRNHTVACGKYEARQEHSQDIERKAANQNKEPEVPPIVHDVLNSPGMPLNPAIRDFFEPHFRHDFSDVRVHTDAPAADSARAVNARAYTVGRHMAFASNLYRPQELEGRRLLAHELAHVVQQQNSAPATPLRIDEKGEQEAELASNSFLNPTQRTIVKISHSQPVSLARQPDDELQPIDRSLELPPHLPFSNAAVEPEDPERNLGTRLWNQFLNGVSVAFYQESERVAKWSADAWATREKAVGPKGSKISSSTLAFGVAIPDTMDLAPTLIKLSTALELAAAKGKPVGAPTPPPGAGPAKIRNLAIFSHGNPEWCGFGGPLGTGKKRTLEIIKHIAPILTTDVNIILYACSTGRGTTEKDYDIKNRSDMLKATMEEGGSDSISSAVRDTLISEHLTSGTVWGHSSAGHVSENTRLREFSAISGKGAAGASYFSKYIFPAAKKNEATKELLDAIDAAGFIIKDPAKSSAAALIEVTEQMYQCYEKANSNLNFQGGSLAAATPTHPIEIAAIVNDYWKKYWTTQIPHSAVFVAKQLQLKKMAGTNR